MSTENIKIKKYFLLVLATIRLRNSNKSKWPLLRNTICATNRIEILHKNHIEDRNFNKKIEKEKFKLKLRDIDVRDSLYELSLLQYKTEFLLQNYNNLKTKIWMQRYRCKHVLNKLDK